MLLKETTVAVLHAYTPCAYTPATREETTHVDTYRTQLTGHRTHGRDTCARRTRYVRHVQGWVIHRVTFLLERHFQA